MSMLHIKYVLFLMAVRRLEEHQFVDQKIKQILMLIVRIYALKELSKEH